MKKSEVTLEQWKRLYDAFLEYQKLAPWKWMLDSDVWAIQNPATGEMGFCCVLGRAGEVLGLCVYRGSEALECMDRIYSGELHGEDPAIHEYLNSLLASFSDREHLEKEDRDVIKRLGYKFHGPRAWPEFRSYLPGYMPWFLSPGEADFLALALEQAIPVARRFREDPDILTPASGDAYLTRVAEQKDGQLVWRDEWREPPPHAPKAPPALLIPEDQIAKARTRLSPKQGTWEFDCFFAPTPVAEGERPFLPLLSLCVHQETGLILGTHMTGPDEALAGHQKELVDTLRQARVRPEEVWVANEKSYRIVKPVADRLGIKVTAVSALPATEQARREMLPMLKSRR